MHLKWRAEADSTWSLVHFKVFDEFERQKRNGLLMLWTGKNIENVKKTSAKRFYCYFCNKNDPMS